VFLGDGAGLDRVVRFDWLITFRDLGGMSVGIKEYLILTNSGTGRGCQGRQIERGDRCIERELTNGLSPQSRMQTKEHHSHPRPHTVYSQTGGGRSLLEPRV
jgi:hypothetical protein